MFAVFWQLLSANIMHKLNWENQLYMVAFIKINRTYLITYNRLLSQTKFKPFLRTFCFLSKKENLDFTYFSITLDKNSHESPLLLLFVQKRIFSKFTSFYLVYTISMLTKNISLLHICKKIFENKHGVLQTIIHYFIPQKRCDKLTRFYCTFIAYNLLFPILCDGTPLKVINLNTD